MLKRITEYLSEVTRYNAIHRMLTIVEVRRGELGGLSLLAVVYALFEGVGLSMLLPILQYAEGGQAEVARSSGAIWEALSWLLTRLNLPLTLPVLLVFAFLPILARQAVFYANAWYSAVVASRIGMRMRMRAVDTVLDADPDFFTRHSAGYLVGVVISQTGAAGAAVLAVIKLLSNALLLLLYVAILLALSTPLTLVACLFAVLVALTIRVTLGKIRAFGAQTTRVTQEVIARIVERFGMMNLIKLRDQKRAESDEIRRLSDQLRSIEVKQARLAATVEVTSDPLLMLSILVTLYIGISVLGMSLAQLGLLLYILNRLNNKVKELNLWRQAISQNMAALVLVKEITDEAASANTIRRGAVPFEGLQRELVLSDVTFEYPARGEADTPGRGDGKRVLDGVSITIPAGSFTALVGRSGAGKSTLVELLPRLRDVDSGSITYDGVDIRDFELGTLRRGVGYLTQSAMLFNDSVRSNLVYGLGSEPTDAQIRDALERAYATFVYDLPHGLETTLGDRGVRFSGGERQRIALARVLLEDTSILILDEPTSALDSESEAYIQAALAALHGHKTLIVIAHRLATVIQADQLVVIEDGRVVERGVHSELLAHGGVYQRLFESQLLA